MAALAIAARCLVAIVVPHAPLMTDMQEYWDRAVHIFEQGRLYPNSWRMPGYPSALAFAFALGAGPSITAARVLNVIAGAATSVLTYWLSRRTVGPRASFVAAAIVALYPSFLIYTTLVATESLVTVPLLGALIASTYASKRSAVCAGLCAGLTVLVRPAGIAVLPLVVWLHAQRRRDAGRARWSALGAALPLLMFTLVMTPWWWHSKQLHGRIVPLDTTGGLNLLIGNGPTATGQWHWRDVEPLHAKLLPGVDVTTPDGSDRATAIATAHMRAHPADVVRLWPAKIASLFAIEGREHGYLYSIGYLGPRSTVTVWLWAVIILASFPLLLLGAFGGWSIRDGIARHVLMPCLAFLGTAVLVHLVSFGDPRFHLPMVPVLAVLATGLARWHSGIHVARTVLSVLAVLLLLGPWARQLTTYSNALNRLTAVEGWKSQMSYDDVF